MTDVIALSDLSDEPRVDDGVTPHWKLHVSPRLDAVLDRLPVNNNTGIPTRIRRVLRNAGIQTLAALSAADELYLRRKGCGKVFMRDIASALAAFDLPVPWGADPVIVRDGATAAEAHVQRLQRWIEERMAACDEDIAKYGRAGAAHQLTEISVLADVMLILDGRDPMLGRGRR